MNLCFLIPRVCLKWTRGQKKNPNKISQLFAHVFLTMGPIIAVNTKHDSKWRTTNDSEDKIHVAELAFGDKWYKIPTRWRNKHMQYEMFFWLRFAHTVDFVGLKTDRLGYVYV